MNVYINKGSRFLPNSPVGNDEMEEYLGMTGGKPSKARRIIQTEILCTGQRRPCDTF